jgi:8-oxo-dGTP pyrophosphatase MutT (NUDIX family)
VVDQWMRDARARALTGGGAAASTGVEALPAATVVLLRDGEAGLEVLLARRSSKLAFHGGAWVFPGGKIDPEDYDGDHDDTFAAAARAAVREAAEEAGMEVDPRELVYLSHWTTPEMAPKRFATWFFVAPATPGAEVVADGSETTALRWIRPRDALVEREAGTIELAPPQYVTLLALLDHDDVAAAVAGVSSGEPFEVTPRMCFADGGVAVCVYDDDAAYDDLDLEKPGPRHRLVMSAGGWVYERSP